jgi:hypothetical protein
MKIKNEHVLGCIFVVAIAALGTRSMIDELRLFYYTQWQTTSSTVGEIVTIEDNYTMTGRFLKCSYTYKLGEASYRKFESLSVDSTVQLQKGSLINVRYNVKKPSIATAQSKKTIVVSGLFSVLIPLSGFLALIYLITASFHTVNQRLGK